MITLPTGTVTFLFTDIEGSTKLWEQQPDAMKIALERHDMLLHQVIDANNGCTFKTVGDAFCAAFSSAQAALNAAIGVQRLLKTEIGAETPIRVRIALHTGAAEERDGDYFGPPVNRVARLLAAGYGDQVLLSLATQELVRDQLPDGVSLRDLGEHRLKDLIRPERIFQVVTPDLPADFPRLRTLDTIRTNLPVQLTSFIGRENEIAAVMTLLETNRLVTLAGPGGTGKTRLSLQVAATLLDSFPDGVWLIELASIADPTLIPQTVGAALGVREEAGRPILPMLIEVLRGRRTLLILDNCEHLIEACAQFANTVLQACTSLQILATSREALGIPGEAAYRVPSLSVPEAHQLPDVEELVQYEAVRLFIERAQTVLPTFTLTEANKAAVAQICQRLDGIPLAIELASARIVVLRAEQIAERLDDRFHLLTGGSRSALPRQQTLRAMIDWSYDLLSEQERTLLRRLSVFAGGWILEAAETVGTGEGLQIDAVLDVLSQLVNKSLVIADRESGEETRYFLLETIRQYAREKLSETAEARQVRDRHLEYYLALAERAEPELIGPAMPRWLKRLDAEIDNNRAALEWSIRRDPIAGMRLANALSYSWFDNRYNNERWFSELLEQPAAQAPTAERARALISRSVFEIHGPDNTEARLQLCEQGLAIYQQLGDQEGIAVALLHLAHCYWFTDFPRFRDLVLESLTRLRSLGNKHETARALGFLGEALISQEPEAAYAYLQEALAICREIGWLPGTSWTLSNLGEFAVRHQNYAEARHWLEESLEIDRQYSIGDFIILGRLGELAVYEKDYLQARRYFEASMTLENERGSYWDIPWSRVRLGYIDLREGDLAHARQRFEQSLQTFKEAGITIGVIFALEGLASLAVAQGQMERAACVFAWADANRVVIYDARPPVEQADVDRDLATIRAHLAADKIIAAQAQGAAMTVEEAISCALDQPT